MNRHPVAWQVAAIVVGYIAACCVSAAAGFVAVRVWLERRPS